MLRRLAFVFGPILVLLVALASCEGPAGPAGSAVVTVVDGGTPVTVTTVSTGTPPPTDGGIPLVVGCMFPCHGFNGIVEQWQTSTHNLAVLSNTDEVPSWTGATACGNCHASDGFPRRLAGMVAPAASMPTNVTLGEVNYLGATGITESTYTGQTNVATIGCSTCHDTGVNDDPHITGGLYVPGSFKLRAPVAADDEMVLEVSPTVGVITGTPAGKWGVSNTCIGCHKSRKDVTQYITATNAITSTHWGPHEGPQADIFTGLGGYPYPGKTYHNSTHQTLGGCATCHMAPVAENGGMPDHSMQVSLKTCQTAGCHVDATSFDVLGGQSTVNSAMGELRLLLNTAGWLTRSAAAPYLALQPADLADTDLTLDLTRPATGLTAAQAGALYNYLLVAHGAASSVHNPAYTRELVYDSIFAMKGAAPSAIPVRP